MLTTDQKEAILRSAGVAVPDRAAVDADARALEGARLQAAKDGQGAARSPREATSQWARTIETLYVEYVARRAAKSLRDAEEARQFGALQRTGE
ncbi:hypothetical protein QTH97_30925 [Variovorax sp. J22R24]|uniref:hypothetical protein n=1 Tax=Variovorax gracilis TaxID=3053502 RepID=UPI002578B84A|nr:hypothetical protein [Variovorax sp. J22R24]MDM0109375.1 hypothetical protein [Variovorax sp. J22R24]